MEVVWGWFRVLRPDLVVETKYKFWGWLTPVLLCPALVARQDLAPNLNLRHCYHGSDEPACFRVDTAPDLMVKGRSDHDGLASVEPPISVPDYLW